MPAKRIILMYISEVSGHHCATIAIEKALKNIQPDIVTLNINAFNYTNPVSEKIINRLYMGVIKRTPQIWDYLYDNPAVVKRLERIKRTVHKVNSPKLKELFDDFLPDAVVCTQAFPCGMVADYKTTYNVALPLVAVLTDYAPHSYWVYDSVDYYITPTEDVSLRLEKKGVKPEKIKALGIPFDPKFNIPLSRQTLAEKFNIDPNLPTILIMGGGQGLGPIKTICKSLEKIPDRIQEIIVTGTNAKLYDSLKKRGEKSQKKTLLFEYADNIEELMTLSDIIITKPGGITTSEVLAKKLAMIIVKPIPGQEANNTNYLTEKKAAIKIEDPKDIVAVITSLLNNPEQLQQLKETASQISKPNASFDIAKLLLNG